MAISLVTGGAGFIGSHIVRALLARGDEVRILDDFSTGKRSNLSGVEDKTEVIEGDLIDQALVFKVVQGVDFIFHLGAIPSVVRSIEEPYRVHQANVTGTLNMLLAAREFKVKKFVFTSSSSIYGDQPTLPKIETMKPEPLSPYAASKLAGEHYCFLFHSLYGVPAVSLRYFNVFGPRQDPKSLYSAVIPRFIDCLVQKKSPTVYGDGLQTRDFCYIDNVVQANLLVSEAPPHALGKVYNIACGESISLLDLLEKMKEIMKVNVQPVLEAARPGDVRHSLAAIDEARKYLNYIPKVSLQEGLKKTIQWFMDSKNIRIK